MLIFFPVNLRESSESNMLPGREKSGDRVMGRSESMEGADGKVKMSLQCEMVAERLARFGRISQRDRRERWLSITGISSTRNIPPDRNFCELAYIYLCWQYWIC